MRNFQKCGMYATACFVVGTMLYIGAIGWLLAPIYLGMEMSICQTFSTVLYFIGEIVIAMAVLFITAGAILFFCDAIAKSRTKTQP